MKVIDTRVAEGEWNRESSVEDWVSDRLVNGTGERCDDHLESQVKRLANFCGVLAEALVKSGALSSEQLIDLFHKYDWPGRYKIEAKEPTHAHQ